ncbi:MAG: hypothetical protein J2P48_08235 [Alphaproteobacteria bacterium]|nr:hypothetical protein [Alphaproteobacteria bacterium]
MIEILTRMRLPVAPEAPDDVARLGDIAFGQGIGVFWFEQDEGNLYFVTDTGIPPPFEIDGGDLFYIVQGT